MNVYTVSLFGHREIQDLRRLGALLAPRIRDLIKTKEYVSFLVGRNGEFDEYAASVIKRVQKEVGSENSEISLVLPYTVANVEYYEKYYDNIIITEKIYRVHPKAAITLKNRWMAEQADLIIVYVERSKGGAFAAMEYAKKKEKRIINLYEEKGRDL